jgi:hypothetical protein
LRITARSAVAPPKITETFFLAEEKHAMRVQTFHDHLPEPFPADNSKKPRRARGTASPGARHCLAGRAALPWEQVTG